ncbi:MAG: SCP2 sterol-binding domain-containing protein [Gammaproteobacteria bacterium]|nr:SCP2 sterol-binding domain-containing protein [Gammaproteobacteria bacterium]
MLLKFINNSLQKYFDSDPEVALQLHELENQYLVLTLTDVNKTFLISAIHSSIIVAEYEDDEDDEDMQEITTTIYTNVIALLRLGLGANYQSMLNDHALRIEGDAGLANQLRTIFMSIDIDWEEVASKYVGDPLAYQLGTFVRRAKTYKQRSVENFRLDVSEYLQEESRITPTKIEVERFLNAVDALDADIERLEARTSRLMQACKQ